MVRPLALPDLTAPAPPTVYDVYDQFPLPVVTVVMRSNANSRGLLAAAKGQLAAVDPNIAMFNAMAYGDAIRESADRPRLNVWVVSCFAGAALVLAMIGIASIVSFTVRDRRRELGIRIALGAPPERVVSLVLGQGLRLALLGLCCGAVIAIVGSGLLHSLLYGIAPTDPVSYLIVFGTLGIVSVVAAWVPAHRAAAIDPAMTMRPE